MGVETKTELIHVGRVSSQELITIINDTYPHLKGMCAYDEVNKSLKSTSNQANFYYDPFHGVVEIKQVIKNKENGSTKG